MARNNVLRLAARWLPAWRQDLAERPPSCPRRRQHRQREIAMAKGQKRSGREPKKPKASKKVIAPVAAGRIPQPAKPTAPKNGK
jgi:hypothetical protein